MSLWVLRVCCKSHGSLAPPLGPIGLRYHLHHLLHASVLVFGVVLAFVRHISITFVDVSQTKANHAKWMADLKAYLENGRMLTNPPLVPGMDCSLCICACGSGSDGLYTFPGACMASAATDGRDSPAVFCRAGRAGLSKPMKMIWYAAPFVFSPAHSGTDYVSTHRVLTFDRMAREVGFSKFEAVVMSRATPAARTVVLDESW